ncbi:Uncharacterised protein [Mycobacteroides abscessus subsp. abscessus]|nr:Uncharacterised protein [Mycobacteroides abscessus subsp. abscessus]
MLGAAYPNGVLVVAAGGNTWVVLSSWESSLQSPSTRALRPLLNMSPTIVMPPRIHCPEPPSSGMLNWAIVPPPELTA